MNQREAFGFLYFGYLPPTDWCASDVSFLERLLDGVPDPSVQGLGEQDLIARGVQAWNAQFSKAGIGEHVVPISGGLDSRATLGGLLGAGLRRQITAITFGEPKSLDYRIGSLVASKTGVRHETVDLTQVPIDREGLMRVAAELPFHGWLFDAYYHRWIASRYGDRGTYWSGYFGDTLSGIHLPEHPCRAWQEATQLYVRLNRFCPSIDLPLTEPELADILPTAPAVPVGRLSFEDQLDFLIREEHATRPVLIVPGVNVRTSELAPEWTRFMLTVPRENRVGRCLYKRVLLRAFPELFALPEKSHQGLPISASRWRRLLRSRQVGARRRLQRLVPWMPLYVNRNSNYLDFDHAILSRADVRDLVTNAVHSARLRETLNGFDPKPLLDRHLSRREQHGNLLTALVSLDIHLEAQEVENRS